MVRIALVVNLVTMEFQKQFLTTIKDSVMTSGGGNH